MEYVKNSEKEIVETILNVFWTQGYKGTTMQDLSSATGLPSHALRERFGDKQAIFFMAFRYCCETYYGQHLRDSLLTSARQRGSLAAVEMLFESVPERIEKQKDLRGCLLINALTETNLNLECTRLANHHFSLVKETLKDIFMSQTGEMSPSQKDALALANSVLATYIGLYTYIKAGYSLNVIRNLYRVSLKTLESYIKVKYR